MKTYSVCLVMALMAVSSLHGEKQSQEPRKTASQPAGEATPRIGGKDKSLFVVKVYELLYIQPEVATRLLQQVLSSEGLNVSSVAGRQQVIISAPASTFEQAEKLLSAVDVPPTAESRDEQLQMLPVSTPMDSVLEKTVEMAVGEGKRVTFDGMRRLIIFRSNVATRQRVEEVVNNLSKYWAERRASEADSEGRLRIVWLADGVEGVVPDDLAPVMNEMGDLGMHSLGLVAQILASNTQLGYSVSATPMLPMLPGKNIRLQVDADQFKRSGDSVKMNVKLTVNAKAPGGNDLNPGEELCSLNAMVTAPLKHLVVIGAMPVEGVQSVFVLQLLPPQASAPAK